MARKWACVCSTLIVQMRAEQTVERSQYIPTPAAFLVDRARRLRSFAQQGSNAGSQLLRAAASFTGRGREAGEAGKGEEGSAKKRRS